MLAWLTTLTLRWKLLGASMLILGTSALGFWSLWRLSSNRAKTAEARAKALEQARKTEQRIQSRQQELRLRQVRLREALKVAKNRDQFEQGWGP